MWGMTTLNVSVVYGVEVPRSKASAFAGIDGIECVHPHGATYPVLYATFSRGELVVGGNVTRETLNVTSLTNEHERGAAEWRRAIIAACAAVCVRVTDEDCGWIVVCDVR